MPEQVPPHVSFAEPDPSLPPGPPDPPRPGSRVAPATLWKAVVRARADLADERHRAHRGLDSTARVVLVAALELYVESLVERGHPVPYALRDELRLQRLTCVTSRGYRPVTRREGPARGY